MSLIDSSGAPMQTEQTTEQKVIEIVRSVFVDFEIHPAGVDLIRNGWQCDGWRLTLKKYKTVEFFDYFTGTGLRKIKKGAIKPFCKPGTIAYKNWLKSVTVPAKPELCGIINSLILDSDADNMSFRDWCEDFGYSEDSLKTFDMYRACCDSSQKLKRIFSRETLAQFRDILQDY